MSPKRRNRFWRDGLIALTAFLLLLPLPASAAGMRVIRDAEIENGLRGMSLPIFAEAGVSADAVRIVLVEDNSLNAFVAGGQNIFLYTGLLMKTKTPEEVFGVIAHETGHIALGHLSRGAIARQDLSFQSILAGVAGIAAGVATGSTEVGFGIARAGQGMAVNSLLTHTRTQESAADQAGTRYLAQARLPATGFLTFMQQLESQELLPASAQSEYIRTHPLTQDRVDFLRQIVAQRDAEGTQGATPAAWRTFHGRMRAKLLGFIAPTRALQEKGDDFDTRYAHSIAHYRKGDIPRALSILETLLKEEPRNAYLYELKGQVLFESGRVAESIAPYARAAELAPRDGRGLIRIAYGHALLEDGKNLKEAVRQLRLALDEEEQREPQAHYFLAMTYGKMGEEGLSRLHLAEQYLLQNRREFAVREANLALRSLPAASPSALRARDILAVAEKEDGGENKERRRNH